MKNAKHAFFMAYKEGKIGDYLFFFCILEAWNCGAGKCILLIVSLLVKSSIYGRTEGQKGQLFFGMSFFFFISIYIL